jgi:hypothetical protein
MKKPLALIGILVLGTLSSCSYTYGVGQELNDITEASVLINVVVPTSIGSFSYKETQDEVSEQTSFKVQADGSLLFTYASAAEESSSSPLTSSFTIVNGSYKRLDTYKDGKTTETVLSETEYQEQAQGKPSSFYQTAADGYNSAKEEMEKIIAKSTLYSSDSTYTFKAQYNKNTAVFFLTENKNDKSSSKIVSFSYDGSFLKTYQVDLYVKDGGVSSTQQTAYAFGDMK